MARGRGPGRGSTTQRVGEELREKLSQLLLRSVSDPRLRGAHVTRVEMSPDLSLARVYFQTTPGGATLEDAEAALKRAAGFLRREIGRTMRLRVTPELRFAHDQGIEDGERMAETLAELARKRQAEADPDARDDDE